MLALLQALNNFIKNTILDILGGLRSACTYVGAKNLKALPRCTTFIRVNRWSLRGMDLNLYRSRIW